MSEENRKTLHCVVACQNQDGNPALIHVRVVCSEKEAAEKRHYELAKEIAQRRGFNKPVWVADQTDPGYVQPKPMIQPIADEKLQREILEAEPEKHFVVGVIGGIAILEQSNPSFPEAPFTAAIQNEKTQKWKRLGTYCGSLERAYLEALAQRYGGSMSQFGTFAARMLGIQETEE